MQITLDKSINLNVNCYFIEFSEQLFKGKGHYLRHFNIVVSKHRKRDCLPLYIKKMKITHIGIACSSSLASCFQPYFCLFCLQMFPGTEGWPFLRYHGSCGRMMAWAGSRPLRSLFNSPLERRADIVYQLLHITQSLSANSLQFSLFYTSVSEDMFGTLDDSRVFIVDASTIGIIDLQEGQFGLNRYRLPSFLQ